MERAKETIFVVDDDPDVREALCDVLASAGYAARAFVDGADALDAMRACPPMLLITDLEMPRLSGLELIEWVRRDDGLKATPVLVLSAEPLRGPPPASRMQKPFDVSMLLDRIRGLLR